MPRRKQEPLPRTVPTTIERSRIMSAIKGKGNQSTEERLRKILKDYGLSGWRRHLPLPGRPDFAFPRHKLAIFVDGCFWHGCPRCFKMPKKNTEFWAEKLRRNRARDRRNARLLRSKGWSVMRVWEHDLKASPDRVSRRINLLLRKGEQKNIPHSF